MDLGISGKTAVVTGGAGGMGRHITKLLLEEGVQVVMVDKDAGELKEAVAWLPDHLPTPLTVPCDLSTDAAAQELATTVADLAGFIPLAESSRQTGVPGATLIAAATALGAQRIIIGGTGLIPAIPGIVLDTAFPVIDAHRTALQMALVQATSGQAHQAVAQVPGPDYVGLAPALTGLLMGRHG